MRGEKKERWMELCEQVANEQDREKFHKLLDELHLALDEKEHRLDSEKLPPASPDK